MPAPCRITSAISGLDVSPSTLPAGKNEVHLKLSPLSKDALLHGHLSLDTNLLKHRIAISGRAWLGAAQLCSPQPRHTSDARRTFRPPFTPPNEPKRPCPTSTKKWAWKTNAGPSPCAIPKPPAPWKLHEPAVRRKGPWAYQASAVMPSEKRGP